MFDLKETSSDLIGLWQWRIAVWIIKLLDFVHCPDFYEHDVSETGSVSSGPVIEASSFYGAQLSRCPCPRCWRQRERESVSETSCSKKSGRWTKSNNLIIQIIMSMHMHLHFH